MPLFEVAIIHKPTPDDEDKGLGEMLVLPPTPVIAKDRESAILQAGRDLPEKEDINRIEILVRPFV
jgi:CO/xanthine dehydrogenase Mo-binding subunit